MIESKHEPSGIMFGPVPSRRLGMSLGIDVVPMAVFPPVKRITVRGMPVSETIIGERR